MKIIKQPNNIKFGLGSAKDFRYPEKSLVITSKGASSRGWLNYTNLEKQKCFHDVEPNPSLDTAKKIISEFNGDLPRTIEELKTLPGIGDYTSRAIMAIVFNKPIIPLDGNVERVLKRVFFLKNDNEISKDNIINKKSFFGKSNRSSDYAQAIMEIGALICKPLRPLCFECPISKNCKSYKKNDFEIKSKNKFNKIKYFEADIYQNRNKYLLIKNNKFKFLKNLLIFPMKEVKKNKFNTSINKKINIKI